MNENRNEIKRSKILIVDDESINIMSLARILKPAYDVIVAIDGKSAIEASEKHIPDIILLDIIMPDINGFVVLSRLKSSERAKEIPVIIITGLDGTEDEEKGLSMGAVDYITKPFHDSIVKARVKTHLKMADYIRTIEKLSTIDILTELPNRRSFDSRICAEWGRALREKVSIGMLMIDIDGFKEYNDIYGHLQGDIVLQAISAVLTDALKRSVDFAARWGGEEFAVLLPDTDLGGALTVAEQIRQNVERTAVSLSNGVKVGVTVSIGVVSMIPLPGDNSNSLIFSADKALYTAKGRGKNRVCYDEKNIS